LSQLTENILLFWQSDSFFIGFPQFVPGRKLTRGFAYQILTLGKSVTDIDPVFIPNHTFVCLKDVPIMFGKYKIPMSFIQIFRQNLLKAFTLYTFAAIHTGEF